MTTDATTGSSSDAEHGPNHEYLEMLDLIGCVEPGKDMAWDEGSQTWLAGSYAACRALHSDFERFPFGSHSADLVAPWIDWDFLVWWEGGPKKLNFVHGEEGVRLHRWWMHRFSPKQIAVWRERLIRPLVDGLIDQFAARGHAELVAELAKEVPLPLILQMLDLPREGDLAREYHDAAHAVGEMRQRLLCTPTDEVREEAALVAIRKRDLLMPYVIERRSGEGDDLISQLWRAAPELYDGEVDEEVVYANVTSLFQAGIGTGAAAIGDVLFVLMRHPEWQQQLRDDESLIPNFVEEALRLTAPAPYSPRAVTRDGKFFGVELKRGDRVAAVNMTGNRDAAHYPHPHEIDAHRTAPRDHFAFAFGSRMCGGQAVARAELQEVVSAVTQRLLELRFDPDKPAPRRVGAGARRPWDSLHATFTAETI